MFEVQEQCQEDIFRNSFLMVKSFLNSRGYKETLNSLEVTNFKDNFFIEDEEDEQNFSGFFSSQFLRRNKELKDVKPEKDPQMNYEFSFNEKNDLRNMLIKHKDMKVVLMFLESKEVLDEEIIANVKLRLLIQDLENLKDENEKIIRINNEKEFFIAHKNIKIVGSDASNRKIY